MQSYANRILVTLACLVIILAGIKSAGEIVVPFLLALFIAIICSPVIKAMTERKIPLWLAITLLLVMIVMIFFFLAGLINSTVQEFRASLPQYTTLLNTRINEISALMNRWNIHFSISKESVQGYFDPSTLMNFVSNLLLGFSNVLSNLFVLMLVVVFMLLEAPTAKHKLAVAISSDDKNIGQEKRKIDLVVQSVISYLGIKTVVGLLTGVCVYVLLEIVGVQYAVLWGTIVFLLNYIPNIGSIIAGVPIVVQALLLNGFSVGFIVAAGVITINMLIGNILEPRIMGRGFGLSTLVVFLSLLFWGWLLGTVGMLLSVPLTIVFKITLEANPNTVRYAVLLGESASASDE